MSDIPLLCKLPVLTLEQKPKKRGWPKGKKRGPRDARWKMKRRLPGPRDRDWPEKIKLMSPTPEEFAKLYAWMRPDWKKPEPVPAVPTTRLPVIRRLVDSVPKRRGNPHTAEDCSPLHVRKIRASLCDEFIKTGNLDQEKLAALQAYANKVRGADHESKKPNRDSGRIPPKLETGADQQRHAPFRHDHCRDDFKPDDDAAR
jgi:hypothetical protein